MVREQVDKKMKMKHLSLQLGILVLIAACQSVESAESGSHNRPLIAKDSLVELVKSARGKALLRRIQKMLLIVLNIYIISMIQISTYGS